MNIEEYVFEDDQDVSNYLGYLVEEGLSYHFDDSPESVFGNDRKFTWAEVEVLKENHDRLWEYCNIWEWFDSHEDAFKAYQNL